MIVYRTAGAWGAGLGRDLLAAEVDGNFHDLDGRVQALEGNPPLPAEIDTIDVTGNQMTITMSNQTVFGPYTLPQAAFNFTGEFQPNHDYKRYDFLVANSGLYMVLHDFTSGAGFAFGADAQGPWYQYVLPFPTNYDIGFFFPGPPGYGIADGAALFTLRTSSRTPFYLPADLNGSTAGLLAAPAADLALPIYKNVTQIGVLDFAAGSTVGTFDFPDAQQFTSPNALRVLRPAALDASAFDLSVLFAGVKGVI